MKVNTKKITSLAKQKKNVKKSKIEKFYKLEQAMTSL